MTAPFATDQGIAWDTWVVVVAACLLAALLDLRSGRIPNWLTGSLVLSGMAWAIWRGGWQGLGDGGMACLLLAAPYFLLFVFTPAGGGAADAKLMGAVGMWLGLHDGLLALLLVTAAGMLLGIAYAIARRRAANLIVNLHRISLGLMSLVSGRANWGEASSVLPAPQSMLPMPYGLSIFVGVSVAAGLSLTHRAGGLL